MSFTTSKVTANMHWLFLRCMDINREFPFVALARDRNSFSWKHNNIGFTGIIRHYRLTHEIQILLQQIALPWLPWTLALIIATCFLIIEAIATTNGNHMLNPHKHLRTRDLKFYHPIKLEALQFQTTQPNLLPNSKQKTWDTLTLSRLSVTLNTLVMFFANICQVHVLENLVRWENETNPEHTFHHGERKQIYEG